MKSIYGHDAYVKPVCPYCHNELDIHEQEVYYCLEHCDAKIPDILFLDEEENTRLPQINTSP